MLALCDGVDGSAEAEEVEELRLAPTTVGPVPVQAVLDPAVDGLDIGPPAVEVAEVWIFGRNGAQELWPSVRSSGVRVYPMEVLALR